MENKEIIEKAMIDLIKKSSKCEENFIFEKLQDYMDFSDGKATWINNVRLRMIENKEAYNNGYEKALAEKDKEINSQIELARQSGYNEACFVKDKKFKEIEEELQERIFEFNQDEFSHLELQKVIKQIFAKYKEDLK